MRTRNVRGGRCEFGGCGVVARVFFAACGCTRGTGARRVEVVSRERQAAAGRTLERVALAKVVVVGLF